VTAIELESRVFFSLSELARFAGIERRRFRRVLESGGVQVSRSGRYYLVCRTELQSTMPKLYEALLSKAAPRDE
jgi:hypothetical protein